VGLIIVMGTLAVSTLMILSAYRAEAEQHKQAEANLYDSLVGQAQALRRARGVGYRGEVWKLLKQALDLRTAEKNRIDLRKEAVACMGDFVGLEPTTWKDFPADIMCLALQPKGVQLALGLKNGTVLVRDRTTGEDIAQLPGHRAPVVSLSFAANGNCIASGDRDGTIQVWQANVGVTWARQWKIQIDRPTMSNRDALGPTISVALSPDGQHLAACSSDQAMVSVWDLAAKAPIREFQGRGGEKLQCLAFSPDGGLLAAGYHRAGAHGILVWDVASRHLKTNPIPSLFAVAQVAFSHDAKLLGAACLEGGMALFDISTFQRNLFLRGDFTWRVAFSPDNNLVATSGICGTGVTVHDLFRNRPVAQLPYFDDVAQVAFSTDRKALVAAGGRSVRIFHLTGTEEKLSLSGHELAVSGLDFSPDGKLLASAGKDGKVKIWNPATGTLLHQLQGFREPPEPVSFSPDGQLLATGDKAGTIRIWDVETWEDLSVPAQNIGREIYAVAFSANGEYFAAGGGVGPGEPGGLVLWHRGGPDSVLERPVRLSSAPVRSLCFSSDSRLLAWLEQVPGPICVHLWDLVNARGRPFPEAQPVQRNARALAFRDGKHLVFTGPRGLPEAWNVESTQQTFSFAGGQFEKSGLSSRNMALSGDGVWLAQSGLAPRVWDLESNKLLLLLPEVRAIPWCFAWSPHKELLAVGLPSGEIAIWNLPKIKAQLDDIGLGW
jgi:WD40 repeat protein